VAAYVKKVIFGFVGDVVPVGVPLLGAGPLGGGCVAPPPPPVDAVVVAVPVVVVVPPVPPVAPPPVAPPPVAPPPVPPPPALAEPPGGVNGFFAEKTPRSEGACAA
jgi:hypothetical protein